MVHVADLTKEKAYTEKLDPVHVAGVELGGVRSALYAPMLKEGELVGFFGLARQKVHPFGEKEVALVTNFAAQAVIAIENARLLNELRQRTSDLTKSFEQQAATSEVLRVVSSSLGDLAAGVRCDACKRNRESARQNSVFFGSPKENNSDVLRYITRHLRLPTNIEAHPWSIPRRGPVSASSLIRVRLRRWPT